LIAVFHTPTLNVLASYSPTPDDKMTLKMIVANSERRLSYARSRERLVRRPLVTINADMVQDAPEAAQEFLAKSGLSNAENWIFDDSFVERLRYEIDPKWQGEIPVTLLIGSNGSIRRIEGSAKLPEVSTWLNQQQAPPPQAP
jgi:hypothetical protein